MNMKRERLLLAAAGCLCMVGGAADLEISVKGVQGGSAIVVRAGATESERYAASEFRDWTERLTGERLRILDDSVPMPPKAIVLGLTRHTQGLVPDAAAVTKGLGDEGFRIVVVPPHIVVLGSACRGITYGVYEILETYGGICWFTPWKTHIPETGRLALPRLTGRIVLSSGFETRYPIHSGSILISPCACASTDSTCHSRKGMDCRHTATTENCRGRTRCRWSSRRRSTQRIIPNTSPFGPMARDGHLAPDSSCAARTLTLSAS